MVLVLGTPLDFRLGYGRPPSFAEDAQVAMVDCDPAELGRNRPLALGLTGHIGLALRQVADALPAVLAGATFADWLGRGPPEGAGDAQARLLAERQSDDVPISHYRMAPRDRRGGGRRDHRGGDGGDVVGCAAKIVPLQRPGQWLDPGPSAVWASGPSFAIAAKLLRPARSRAPHRRRWRLRAERHGDRRRRCASACP